MSQSAEQTKQHDQLLNEVRTFVVALLKQDVDAPQISRALAYIATELGLRLSDDKPAVFAVTLSAIAQAARDHGDSDADSPEPVEPEALTRPADAVLH